MSRFSIIGSKPGYNYILNPSFEKWIAVPGVFNFWTASNSPTILRDTLALFGPYCLQLQSSDGALRGIYQEIGGLTPGATFTLSVYAYNVSGAGVQAKLIAYDGGGTTNPVQAALIAGSLSTRYSRLSVSKVVPGSGSIRVFLGVSGSALCKANFEAVQAEPGALSSYFDGDREGCSWEGLPHLSRSIRSASAVGLGEPVDMASLGGKVLQMAGGGSPVLSPITSEDASGNVDLIDYLLRPRGIGLALALPGSDINSLHSLRKSYIDLLMPKRGEGAKVLRYQSNNQTLQLPVRYEGGLEAPGMGGLDGQIEKVGLRLTAYQGLPTEEAPALAGTGYGYATITPHYGIRRDDTGLWTGFPTGLPSAPTSLAAHPDGSVWGVIPVMAGSLQRYELWATTGAGGSWVRRFTIGNSTVSITGDPAFRIAPNGQLWIAATQATWIQPEGGSQIPLSSGLAYSSDNGATWTTVAYSGPGNEAPYDIAFDTNGTTYVVGSFTAIGGVGINQAAKFYLDAFGLYNWDTILPGNPAIGNYAEVIAVDRSYVYIGGNFTTVGGTGGYNGFIRVSKSSGAITNMGNGAAGNMRLLTVDTKRGTLFSVGHAPDLHDYLQYWTGSTWVNMVQGGFDTVTFHVCLYDPVSDRVWLGGDFTSLTYKGVTYSRPGLVAIQGNTVYYPEIALNDPLSGNNVPQAGIMQGDELWVSYKHDPALTLAGAASISATVDRGTAEPYPIFSIAGAGLLHTLEHLDTGARLRLEYQLQKGELLILDLRPGHERVYSTINGDVSKSLDPTSNIQGFYLLKGTNNILARITGNDSSTQVAIQYYPTYWSLDS